MTTTNSYKDTKAIDYLEAIKRNQLESRNSKSSSSNFDMTYMLPMTSDIGIATTFTNTEKTLGDYDVVDNTGKLVAFLPFDYDVLDASNNNDGTITGTETYVDGPEISSTHPMRKAFSFNGSTYITLANESNFDFEHTNAFSVSFWVKCGTISATTGLVTKANSNATAQIGWKCLLQNNGTVTFNLSDGTTTYGVTTTTDIDNNIWRFLCFTYSGNSNRSGMKIYIDGSLDNTGTSSTISSTILNNVTCVIGAFQASNYLTGSIDNVQIWNVELTSSDITDLYAGKQINRDTTATNPAILGLSDVT